MPGPDRPGYKCSIRSIYSLFWYVRDADKLHKIISESKLPNMFKPRRDNYIKIESMPLLGSGKLDVMGLRKIALAAKQNSDRQ